MSKCKSFYVRFRKDERLRVHTSLLLSLLWNLLYAVFQLYLGLLHQTFWYGSFAFYHFLLAGMRFSLLQYVVSHRERNIVKEWKKYRRCGLVLLVVTLSLSVLVSFLIARNPDYQHHEIVAIAMATYTFTAFGLAVANAVKYKKYNSPVYSASKIVSLTAACVSILTLASTMLSTFGGEGLDAFSKRLLLALSGGAAAVFIVTTAIYMTVQSTKTLKKYHK